MTRIRLVKKTFFAANRVMILVVIFAALLEHCLASSLGSKCQHDMDCTDFIKGSTCSMNGYCECAPYFVQYNVTTCLSSQLLGGDCILADQCTMKVANSSCLDGACRCVEGFLQFRKHTCLGPAHPGAVCYSHAHCQMNDRRSHCDFLIPNLFGRCQCTSPAKQYGGMCIENDSSVEADSVLSQTTTNAPLITPPSTVFRPIDLISHYELSTQGHPLLINNNEISFPSSSTEKQVEFTKLPELSVSSSSEQAGGEDLTADTEAFDVLNNYHISSPSTQEPAIDVAQQAVTSDDYPYKIDSETSINEEEMEQIEENPQLPVVPAEEVVLIPHEESNEIIKLDNEIQVQKETEVDLKPEDEEQSENISGIQLSTETILVPESEQESNEEQHSEIEQEKHEEEIQPQEELVTELSAEIEHIPEFHPENEAEQEVDFENSEAARPHEQLDHNNVTEDVSGAPNTVEESSHVFEQVDSPDKSEFQDNISQSEESAASPENSEEKIDLSEPEMVDEASTDHLQTSNPIEFIEQELPHDQHLSEQEGSILPENVLPEENLSQSSQESSGPLNLESEETADPTEQPIDSNYDVEQEQQHQASEEKDKESAEEQTSSGGSPMEESHYRPSSDLHSQEEAAVADEEVEAHIDMIGEMIPISSQEHKETPVVQEESEIGSGDISQALNIETEDEAPQTNYVEDQSVPEMNQAQSEFGINESPTQTNDIVEDIQEGNVQEQVPQETNSQQSIEESQQVAQEAPQEQNVQEQHPELASLKHPAEVEKEAAEPTQEENKPQQVLLETIAEESTEEVIIAEEAAQEEILPEQDKIQDEKITEDKNKVETNQAEDNKNVDEETWHSTEIENEKNKENENQSEGVIFSVDQTKPSLDKENSPPEKNLSEQINKDKIPDLIEENYHTSEEEIKINKVDQENNNSAISELESGAQVHKDTNSSTEDLDQTIVGEEQQQTIEELLQVAAQVLAEKGTEEMNSDQNKEEIQSITEKPVVESEEESLQTLQEEEPKPATFDDLIFMPDNPAVLPEENIQEKEDSTPKSTEEEYSLSSNESESEEHTNPIEQEVIPEMITEAVESELQEALPEKVIEISSIEDQDQTLNTDLATESVLQNDPLEELPAATDQIVENEAIPISLGELLQGEPLKATHNNILGSTQESVPNSEDSQIALDTQEEEYVTESIENAEPSRVEEQELLSTPDLIDFTAPIDPQEINSDHAVSIGNELPAAEKEGEIKETVLKNESSNEAIQQVHDLENIIEGAEPSNIAYDNNPVSSLETLPSKILTSDASQGDETLALDVNPISSDENTIGESNEKIESDDNALGTHPENKPIVDEVKEIDIDVDKIKENEEELLENDQATTVRSESEQNSDHEPLVHPTFELEETQQVVENVNDKQATDIEEANETQSGANANESEPAATEYVSLVAVESETLATPVAAAAVVEPEISEIIEKFENNHLFNEPSEIDNDNEDNLSEEATVTTISPTNLETPQIIEQNIENDLKASGDAEFNENESVLSILSGLIENEEEGSGTQLPETSIDDLKAEETVHSEQAPSTGSYYPSLLSDLLMSTKSEEVVNNKPTTGPLNDSIENFTPEELPFDLSFVSPNDHEELMSDNLVVETTPSVYPESSSEDSITTEVPDILEITTQTMLGLASRVTLMEPAAPIATTLKPFMTMEEDFSTTSSSLNIDSLITSKPVRKRVELGNGPVSLGLNCNNDKQCQLADPNTICSDQGICDCTSKTTAATCSAERTGCSAGTFQCRSSGVCISWFFVCDGRPDCTDASDEECTFNARLNQTCPTESFRCERSGRCISRAALCDGRKQCPHGEDEFECDSLRTEGGQCPPNTFRCNSGECLPEYEYCNAIISCKDGSDEPPHLCGSRSVPNIFLRLLTAAVVDDGSAKSSRGGINAYCPHRCSNGRCRSTAIVCSGRDGCGDGTDEETCSVCRCPAPADASTPAQFLARQPPMPLWK